MAMSGDILEFICLVQEEKGGDREEDLQIYSVEFMLFLQLEYWDRQPKVVWDKTEEMEMFISLTREQWTVTNEK